jgi:hypothetical protein
MKSPALAGTQRGLKSGIEPPSQDREASTVETSILWIIEAWRNSMAHDGGDDEVKEEHAGCLPSRLPPIFALANT